MHTVFRHLASSDSAFILLLTILYFICAFVVVLFLILFLLLEAKQCTLIELIAIIYVW